MKGAIIACIVIAMAGVGGLIWYGAEVGDISEVISPEVAVLSTAPETSPVDDIIAIAPENVAQEEEIGEIEEESPGIVEDEPPMNCPSDNLPEFYQDNLSSFRFSLNPFVGYEPFTKTWGVGLNSAVGIGHWSMTGGVYKPLTWTYEDTLVTMGVAYTW